MFQFRYEVIYNDNVVDEFTSSCDAYGCAAIYSLDKILQPVFVQLVYPYDFRSPHRHAVFVKGVRVWSLLDIKGK